MRALISSVLHLVIISSVSAFIPRPCADNVTAAGASVVCCPLSSLTETPCGYPIRGECRSLSVNSNDFIPIGAFKFDIRYQWPHKIYSHLCECVGNFDGFSCDDCRSGWSGPLCTRKIIRLRKNILHYNDRDKQKLQNILLKLREIAIEDYVIPEELPHVPLGKQKLKTVSVHHYLTFIHNFASRPLLILDHKKCEYYDDLYHLTDCNHGGPGFLTWHRQFMILWEDYARRVAKHLYGDDEFTFPYWDWTDKEECEICSNDLICSEESSGSLDKKCPFAAWQEFCPYSKVLCFPCHIGNRTFLRRNWKSKIYPDSQSIYEALSKSIYYSSAVSSFLNPTDISSCGHFCGFLEGLCKDITESARLHNRVHDMIVGSFYGTRASVNDPLFIFHHIQIDRILERWIRLYGHLEKRLPNLSFRPGQCADCNLVGIIPRIRHRDIFKSSEELGYDYDSFKFGAEL